MNTAKSLGVNVPFNRSVGDAFDLTYTTFDHIRAKLINLLNTEKYERVMSDFGIEKKKYLFALFNNTNDDIDDQLIDEIETAVKRWIPEILVDNILVEKDIDRNKANIQILFKLTPTDNPQNLTVTFI